jgi:divalent anion:Na+ symporter, DASS family
MTKSYAATFVAPLLADALLGRCRHADLARLLPHVTEHTFQPGQQIFAGGSPAEVAYLVLEGVVELRFSGGSRATVERSLCGEEAGSGIADYLADAVAVDAVRALAIPRAKLTELLKTHPELRDDIQKLLLARARGEAFLPAIAKKSAVHPDDAGSWREVVGWGSAIVLPTLVMILGRGWGLQPNAVLFLAVFAATVVMWVFSLVDEYVPGLFALFAILVLGLAPPAQVLAGFASDGFFLAMSILGLGTVIVASGLSYRFLLWLLLKLPSHPFWQNLGLLATGFLLTPLVPSINGRVALVTPLMLDMQEILGFRPGGAAATRLAVSAFTGASLLSAIFLTSKSVNFVVFGLLSTQGQNEFQWLYWCFAALVAGGVMLSLHLAACSLFFRGGEQPRFSRRQSAAQLRLLGPLKGREWAALFGIVSFMLGVATVSLHKIQPPWLALIILYVMLLFGFLRKNEFKEKIDWPFLMYLGGLIGITGGFNAVGLDKWLAQHMSGLGDFMRGDLGLFLLALFALLFVVRLAVPISATIVIAATVFMPLAEIHGVNPWIIGMAILILGEMWFFPYQCSYYVQFREIAGRHGAYDEPAFLRYNALMNGVKLLALYASLPYWKWLGLL